jgi:hypothetical protein
MHLGLPGSHKSANLVELVYEACSQRYRDVFIKDSCTEVASDFWIMQYSTAGAGKVNFCRCCETVTC